MEKTKTVNFTPRHNYILISCHVKKIDTKLALPKGFAPEVKSIQQILKKGPVADENLNEGDWVMIDMERFKKHVKVQSRIKAGVGGGEMIEEKLVLPFFEIPGDDTVYLKITDREIEGVIPQYNKLPNDVKDYTTMSEFIKKYDLEKQ